MINRTKRYSLIALILLIILPLLFTGCGSEEKNTRFDEEGNLLPINNENINYEGTYYIERDGQYYSLCPYGLKSDDDTVYQWMTSSIEPYIPEFKKGDKLVYVNISERPTSTILHLMEDCGYSLGTTFETYTENGESCVRFSDNYCEYSPIGTYIKEAAPQIEATKITEINGKTFSRNMIDEYGFMHGLTKGAMYQLGFYKGTVFAQLSLKADTHFFIKKATYSSTSYKAVKKIYYEVDLPENLENGYYAIPNQGMFKYNLEDNIMLPNGVNIDDIGDEVSETSAENKETEAETTATEQE